MKTFQYLVKETSRKYVSEIMDISLSSITRILNGKKPAPPLSDIINVPEVIASFKKMKKDKKDATKQKTKLKKEAQQQEKLVNGIYEWAIMDTETASNGDLLDGLLYVPLLEKYHFFQNWDELEHILSINNDNECYRNILCHNGGGFDYPPFFLSLYQKVDYLQMAMSGSNIIFATLKDPKKFKRQIKFSDTLKVFSLSLAKACKAFKVKTPKEDIPQHYYSHMEDFKKDHREDYYRYLKTDCVSLHQCCVEVCKILDQTEFPVTAGQMALNSFMDLAGEEMEKCASYSDFLKWNKEFKKFFPGIDGTVLDNFIEQGMIGGRVEVFRRGDFKTVSSFDIVSLYPSAYREMKVPTGKPSFTSTFQGHGCIGFYEVVFNQRNRNIPPILLIKNNKKGLQGSYYGKQVITNHEYKMFQKYSSGDSKLKVIKGIYWSANSYIQPFLKFTDKFFELKNQGGGLKQFAKICLNSLYGKFNQKGGAESLIKASTEEVMKSPEEYKDFSNDTPNMYIHVSEKIPKHRKNYISALITSITRTMMYPYIRDNSERLLYMDTDSIHIFGLPHTFKGEVTHSKELGKMEQETPSTGVQAIYLMRKGYIKGDVIKMKGFANKCSLGGDELNREHFLKMLKGEKIDVYFNSFPRTKAIIKGTSKACKKEKKTKILQAYDKYTTNWKNKIYIEGEERVIVPSEKVFVVQHNNYC